METNQYEFDRTQQQKQLYPNKPMAENVQEIIQAQNQQMPKRNVRQKPGTQAKMPKARAMELANALKRTLAVASIISFGMFGGLVAMHQVGAITTQSTSGSSNTSSNQNASSQNSNNFFNQQGGNTNGTSSTTSSSSSAAPVTGTTTS